MTKAQLIEKLGLSEKKCRSKAEEFSNGPKENIMAEMIWTHKAETYDEVIRLLKQIIIEP
jgi:hypothetical protein